MYSQFNSDVPAFITDKLKSANGDEWIYKYFIEKGQNIIIDNIENANQDYYLEVYAPKEGDIVFKQHINEGDYFLFSDNPEAIKNKHLAKNNFALTRFEQLKPGRYTFMSWHKNDTDINQLKVDVQLYAEPGTKITFKRIGINAAGQTGYESDWTSPLAYANFIGWKDITSATRTENIDYVYKDINIEKVTSGNEKSIWLSDAYQTLVDANSHLPQYPTLNNGQFLFLIFEIEIDSEVTLNEVAYSNRSEVSIGSGNSAFDASQSFKGISNSYFEIETDFDYTIDGNEFVGNDGMSYIPVTLYNLNNPLGYTASYWETHVNPQEDSTPNITIPGNGTVERVRDIATETELLMYTYKDINKIDRYGSDIPYEQRNDIWYFDQYHKRLNGVPEGGIPSSYVPNELSKALDYNEQISMANYSVLETYNIHFKNITNQDKTLKFYLDSNSLVMVRNENLRNHNIEIKEKTNRTLESKIENGEKVSWYVPEEEWMATMTVPANSDADYKLSVVLVTAHDGSIRNYFRVE